MMMMNCRGISLFLFIHSPIVFSHRSPYEVLAEMSSSKLTHWHRKKHRTNERHWEEIQFQIKLTLASREILRVFRLATNEVDTLFFSSSSLQLYWNCIELSSSSLFHSLWVDFDLIFTLFFSELHWTNCNEQTRLGVARTHATTNDYNMQIQLKPWMLQLKRSRM